MKTIIFAGGWGSRLDGYNEHLPKPMVTIGSKPMLWHIMKIYSYYGYNDFIILLGYKSEVIKNYFLCYDTINSDFSIDLKTGELVLHNQNDKLDWKITLVNTGLNTLKGARLKKIENYLSSKTNMVTYGDGIANIDINKLSEFHSSHGKTLTITGVHPPARFGELIEKDGKIEFFQEKPQISQGIINGGFMVFNNNLMDYLSVKDTCDFERGPIEKLAKEGEIMVYHHEGQWECMDHGRDVVHLNKLWKSNRAFWKIW